MFKKDFYFEHSPILSYTQCIYNIHRLGPKTQGSFYGIHPWEKHKEVPVYNIQNQTITHKYL